MKRNWYAAAILLVLCLLLYLAGRYVTDTTDAMQAGVQRAYALAEQGDYPAARAAYAQTTRRAERQLWRLFRQEKIDENLIVVLNRLSDLCFTLSRIEIELPEEMH